MLVLDAEMPGLEGPSAVKQIKNDFPALKIIILSDHPVNYVASNYVPLEIDAYLTKETDAHTIVETVHEVYRNNISYHKTIIAAIIEMTQTTQTNKKMSEVQLEVFRLICGGYMNKEIAAIQNTAIGTVDYHIKNIKRITNCESRAELIVFAIENAISYKKKKTG